MKMSIPYGKKYLEWNPPANIKPEIIYLKDTLAAKNQLEEVKNAIDNPIGSKKLDDFQGIEKVAIAIADLTRPVPHKTILPLIIAKLEQNNVRPENITLIVGTGLHRVSTQDEWEQLVGKEILDKVNIISHEATNPDLQVNLGVTSRGTPVEVNKYYAQADLKIVVGMIEPHQFEGYTGGAKGMAIGLGSEKLITANHSLLTDKNSLLGKVTDNPAREDVDEVGKIAGIDFIVNVVLNDRKEIVKAVAGDFIKAHRAGVRLAREIVEVPVSGEMDLVITSPGGFPKDLNVYQAQKALAHASLVVKKGGVIILTAECSEGVGEEKFLRTMAECSTPQEVLDKFGKREFEMGIHKALLWCRSLAKADTILISDYIDEETSQKLLVQKSGTLAEAFTEACKKIATDSPKVAVMAKASSTIPILL